MRHRFRVVLLCFSILVSALGWANDLGLGYISPVEHASIELNDKTLDAKYSELKASYDHSCHSVVHGVALPSSGVTLTSVGGEQSHLASNSVLPSRFIARPERPPRA